jgi:integrase
MARVIDKLNDASVRNAKPDSGGQQVKLADGGGLYLLIHPNGGKYWRMNYRFGNRQCTLALGVYPDVSLKKARERRDNARKQIADGIDPSAVKQAEKQAQADSFEAIAKEWNAKRSRKVSSLYADKTMRRLERDIFPWLGRRPIKDIQAPDLLAALQRIEKRGAHETAHRTRSLCGEVFRYAIATGRAERDPSTDLRGALTPVKHKSMATITDPKNVGALLRAIADYSGAFVTRCALQLAPLLFVRPGELRYAEWSEIDLDALEWRIPAHKMKMKDKHIVPLSTQAVAILRELHPFTERGRYVFPSVRTPDRPMSDNTVNAALRRMGFEKSEIVGHGFRAMASTLLHEMGWQSDVIERQLAHAERNKVKAAYNHAQYLPERRKMMQAWADYLDALRDGAEIIPFKRKTD